MSGKWTTWKNLGWALGIVVCLLALFVGFIIAIVNRYSGDTFSGSTSLTSETVSSNSDVTELTPSTASETGDVMTLEETSDAGQEYIDKLTFLCDSALIGMRDFGLLSGGTGTTQVWGTSSGTLRVADLPTANIVYPSDGSSITIADAAMIAKPEILVICVGQDGLAAVDESTFKTCYSTMISNILNSSPDTKIICCTISSVSNSYSGVDDLTPVLIGEANEWIREVSASLGVYYTDAGKAVGDGSGAVGSTYLSSNSKTLNSSGINQILNYLRTHALTTD
jgi:hypothetical protein